MYCNTGFCIAEFLALKARTVLQYSHCAHDTARAWALGRRWACRQQAGRWACWRWARRKGLRGVRAGRAGRARQAGMRGARGRGVQASGTAWASEALAGARARGRASGRAGVSGSDERGRAERAWWALL